MFSSTSHFTFYFWTVSNDYLHVEALALPSHHKGFVADGGRGQRDGWRIFSPCVCSLDIIQTTKTPIHFIIELLTAVYKVCLL